MMMNLSGAPITILMDGSRLILPTGASVDLPEGEHQIIRHAPIEVPPEPAGLTSFKGDLLCASFKS